MKKVIIISIILIFLVGLASAENNYGQYKNGIIFKNNVDVNDFTIVKDKHTINIKSDKHYETSIKIPYSELENLDGFKGTINIKHYTDSGFNDWSKTITPENENGYVYLDLEFSTVVITTVVSSLSNWNFELWDNSTHPTDWTIIYAGGAQSTDAFFGNYSYRIGSGSGYRGAMYRNVSALLEPNTSYVLGSWIKWEDTISGYVAYYVHAPNDGNEQLLGYQQHSPTSSDDFYFVSSVFNTSGTVPPYALNLHSVGLTTGGYVYVDAILIGEEIDITGTETTDDWYANLTFVYNPEDNITSECLVIEYETIDLGDSGHGKIGNVSADIDGTPVTCYRGDSKLYFDAISLTAGTNYTFNVSVPYNLPPTLLSPTNGSTIEREFPPLYDDITFTWEDTGTTCQIQVSEDTAFSNVVYSGETTADTRTISLAEGTYYWRVRSYDSILGTYGNWPDTFNFVIVSTSSTTGNGVHGVVFEAESLGSSIPLPSALVTIYNDTYSDTAITGPEGYYQFPVSNGTYIVYASLSGYDTSALLPVNVSGNYTILNIPLIKSESYFAPHYVRFVVTDSWYWERYVGATVTVYENEDTTVLFSETTGSDGAVGFELSENIEYRIVTTYGSITQTDYISPTENTYYIVLDDITTSLLPENQFYDVVTINITKNEINSTNAQIIIQYNDTADSTNSVSFVLGQTYSNGTLNVLVTSAVYNGNCSVTFGVTDYLGQSYIIKAVIDHDDFGEVTKYFAVDFPSNNLPFTGKGVVYLCIIILFVVAAQFGKADNTQGAILLCGLTWFMYAMDVFITFGESINTLIGIGLGISTAYAVLAYINKKRTDEGI